MNKIKKFIKDHEKGLKMTACGITTLVIGVRIGRIYEKARYETLLDNLARTGKTINNFVDGKEYKLSITEVKNLSLT